MTNIVGMLGILLESHPFNRNNCWILFFKNHFLHFARQCSNNL